MHSKILGLGLISGLMSAAAFAEPPIQPGDTLESLSKVKIVTTVNGQPGSIQDLVSSGQVQLLEAPAGQVNAAPTEQPLNPEQAQANQIDPNAPAVPANAEQAATEAENALANEQQSVAAAPTEQSVPTEQTAVANTPEAVITEAPVETAQQAPEAVATDANAAPVIASSAEAPVNADSESAALPEAPQAQQDAFMAAPETQSANPADASIQANPEAPVADEAIQAAPEASADVDATIN